MAESALSREEKDFRQRRNESGIFVKEHLNVKEGIETVRIRYGEILELLGVEKINKHDLGHQWRTLLNADMIMAANDTPLRERIVADYAAGIHDLGYNVKDKKEEGVVLANDPHYMSERKKQFRKHALNGAIEAKDKIRRMIKVVERRGEGEIMEKYRKLLSYKDEHGEWKMLDEKDIALIEEAILNHNDYGKDADDDYDPSTINKAALAVQIGDKIDNCRDRIYKEHMSPDTFIETEANYDKYYFHRSVSYCIEDYYFDIDKEAGKMHLVYNVNLSDFVSLVQSKFPGFQYSEEQFELDFLKAYTKSCRVAAEAMGVILERQTDQPTLEVELSFESGQRKIIPFARPYRGTQIAA